MKTMFKITGLLAVVLLLGAGSAQADGVKYTITSPDGTEVLVFTLPQSPTTIATDVVTCDVAPCGTKLPGSDFQIANISGTVNGTAETLGVDFFANYAGKSGLDVYVSSNCSFCSAFRGFEWGATSLFSGTDDNPFLLTSGPAVNLSGYTVGTSQVPEPSSLLLLGFGAIAVLALALKRAA